jgi:CRP-like cAMP-binding protein
MANVNQDSAQGGVFPAELMEKVLLLKGIPLFSRMSAEQLLPVAEIVNEVSYGSGEVIFHEGDPGDELYLVMSGSVEVLRHEKQLAVLGANECFGDMAMLDQEVRSATIRVVEPVSLLAIAREDFLDLLDLYPALAKSVIGVLITRLRGAGS